MKPLFETKSEYTYDEYLKFSRTVQNKVQRLWLLQLAMMAAFLVLAWLGWKKGSTAEAVAGIVVAVLIPVIFRLVNGWTIKQLYKSNHALQGQISTFRFYRGHFEQDNALGHTSIPYDKLVEIVETKTNFYLMIDKNQGMILVKDNCSPELIAFVQNLKK